MLWPALPSSLSTPEDDTHFSNKGNGSDMKPSPFFAFPPVQSLGHVGRKPSRMRWYP